MQAGGNKTKLFIPAIAGTQHPVGVGDQPGRLGEGRNRIHRAATKCDINIGIKTANRYPGTKKTTHAMHRRFAFTSSVSAADAIRLPNWAEFGIRVGS